ncbi:Uncharacterized protein F13E6.1 [Toxocara canis]|uniref:Uncharacterized protein F13E6.1 n=1 Tax=Toxocara canis TaxID=6265 RepID=A0A0B2URU5_TOXCA|nr:Uncharacterized protein F13E6.1 [Toxocara canis]
MDLQTEDEINTLRQVLAARQKHAADLKRKLGISPLTELTADINQSLQHVKESQAYQKTTEVVAGTADTVKSKWNDMRNSSLFKSFESKLGTAYTNVRVGAASECSNAPNPPQNRCCLARYGDGQKISGPSFDSLPFEVNVGER